MTYDIFLGLTACNYSSPWGRAEVKPSDYVTKIVSEIESEFGGKSYFLATPKFRTLEKILKAAPDSLCGSLFDRLMGPEYVQLFRDAANLALTGTSKQNSMAKIHDSVIALSAEMRQNPHLQQSRKGKQKRHVRNSTLSLISIN